MKKSITAVVVVSAISALGSSAAFAQSVSNPTERALAAYGYASNASPARTVTIDTDTRHINVTRLETVALKVGGKTVNWTFDTLGTNSFPLSKAVPGVGNVMVYLEESPLYRGGS